MGKIEFTEQEWRERLDKNEYRICREAGTEPAFTGKYWDHKGTGNYLCRGCGEPLFLSDTKYDSGSGWPSFWKPVNELCINENVDMSHGMHRVEIVCATCDSHLGHVFTDGPAPTGLRYCVNSASLDFEASDESTE